MLGNTREIDKTAHVLYVRNAIDDDMSVYLKRIHFKLLVAWGGLCISQLSRSISTCGSKSICQSEYPLNKGFSL